MTKVVQLIMEEAREEFIEQSRKNEEQARRNERIQVAREMLADGKDISEVLKYGRLTSVELDTVLATVKA